MLISGAMLLGPPTDLQAVCTRVLACVPCVLAREDVWWSGSRLECQAHLSEGDGRRAMRLLPIALGLPGTIGFPTAIAHHRSPHGQVTEVSYTGKNFIVYHLSHSNSAPTSRMDCFVDSLLAACKELMTRTSWRPAATTRDRGLPYA